MIKRDMPKFDTLLLHYWSNLRRKYLSQIPTDINETCWVVDQKHKFRESRMPFPLRDIPKKSSQHVRACAAGDFAICSKNRKIVPYHGANPNTRNGARLRSPSPIMAPVMQLISPNHRMRDRLPHRELRHLLFSANIKELLVMWSRYSFQTSP